MNPLKRHEKIMEALIARQEITVQELSELLDVTGKTVREDLDKLEQMGLLVRVHGGAILAQGDQYGILSSQGASGKHNAEKAEIAERALTYIQAGEIIALDGGSTILELARRLPNQELTVITNDLFIISELVRRDQIRLIVPGGARVRNVLTGEESVQYVRQLNIHKAFVSATAVHPEFGLSIYTGELTAYKKALMHAAQQVYGMVDHYKFGHFALRTFARCDELDGMISDSGLDRETAEIYEQAGLRMDYGQTTK
ncbi:DeoR/GlpR family DNA-binding transcription regulator [Paenibacillus sp. JX-17]|uniref:DeoR/GlpR family DNA-binding transcription regulator n=1 Tax=Paenibacillus lacisoli TaxID=3064525 RepID=A0ABT9CF32_9BACL|nr:DeoR/GlpR family DNA-binding transcription regulator [Paenibacillus sp. JX-17]MDO7907878.1 DeoR/GlpR family DNA-binding transcription regulator [Paenibacillus sp. JX-17]